MKRIINYIRQWMTLRKREKAVAKLEREMQDRYAYICGYIQAEKDLELTWEDIKVIEKTFRL